ncbi:trypsin-like serine peptidase [Longispora urticae]
MSPSILRRSLTGAGTVATVLLTSALCVTSGAAASTSTGDVLDYWTASRMAAATASDAPTRTAPADAAPAVLAELTRAPRPYTDAGTRVHGKVFYTQSGGRNSWCSASVVTAPNRSLVWSAAHCLSGTTNVLFVPAYNSAGTGDAPYGRWPARRVVTSGNDHAVVVVSQVGGRYLQDVVGANGIRFTGPVNGRTTIWGYPAARIWTGRDLTYCHQPTRPDGGGTTTACDTEGGSSGGGYVTGNTTPTGLGYLWANHTAGSGATAYGSVFGTTAKRLYDANSS